MIFFRVARWTQQTADNVVRNKEIIMIMTRKLRLFPCNGCSSPALIIDLYLELQACFAYGLYCFFR